jgi:sialidase-1
MRISQLVWGRLFSVLLTGLLCAGGSLAVLAAKAPAKPEPPKVKIVQGGESHLPASQCRKMIVGPGVNQPDPFPGYGGFVGWECPARLRDGTMYVSFNAGYWHASPPTPIDPGQLKEWTKIGYPANVQAPRGGRAMIAKSTDDGVTWTKPTTLVDTPWDDRHPAIAELSDGTLVCTLFTYPSREIETTEMDPSKAAHIGVIRSLDGGKTWDTEVRRMPPGFTSDATDGPAVELPDKTILLAGEGKEKAPGRWVIGIFESADGGATWRLRAKVATDHDQYEPSVVRLKDGRLVMITRPEGAITWSGDEGRTWTPPVTFGFRMYAPTLLVLADGTLLCHYGSYIRGGLKAMFSTDGGKTWVAPGPNYGFVVDGTYGYSRSCLMPDGSAYLAYIGTGGHHTEDARTNMIWSIRLRVRPDHAGIELVPVVR